jgi:hypothetical protein
MTDQCSICCDTYTSVLRKVVTCQYCDYKACSICVKRYLVSGTVDPHCMSCRREWNDDFLDTNFTKAFRTGIFRKHREDILVEREFSILPTRQPRVEATVKLNTAVEKMAKHLNDINKLEELRRQLYARQSSVRAEIVRYTAESEGRAPPAWTLTAGEKAAPEKAKFIMKCPGGDCRGFLSTAYKCGTCQMWACPDCLVMKGEDKDSPHTCDPGQKESVSLIIKETKPCPKCGQRICKVEGCDQMWCTDCHTAFSWVTGQLVNGVIHNPHYYEFLRSRNNGVAPRNIGDVPCGGIPHYMQIERVVNGMITEHRRFFQAIHRITSEIEGERINMYQGHFNVNDNGDLGVKYLMKSINKEELKYELAKREIKRNKHLAIRGVLEMFVTTSTTLLNNMLETPPKADEDIQMLMLEFRNLRQYVNDALLTVSRMKNCSVPQLSESWRWLPFNKSKAAPKARKSKVSEGATATTATAAIPANPQPTDSTNE